MRIDITDKKYLKALECIKEILSSSNNKSIYQLVDNQRINAYWSRFLVRHKVVYLENGFYRWNEKIPPSSKLVQKFREEFTLAYKKYKTPQEMKSIQTPPEIKRRKRTPAVVVEQTPQPQVGLIRKFLRWLY
jgi:hypothetical protein